MTEADLQANHDTSGEDLLEMLEGLAVRLPEAIRERDAGDALRATDEAVVQAEADIAMLERLAGILTLAQESIGADERVRLQEDVLELEHAGDVISAAANAQTLDAAAEELSSLPNRVQLVERVISRAWQARVDGTFGASDGLGRVLQEIPETRNLGAKISRLHAEAIALKHRQDDADTLAEAFAQFQTQLSRFHAELARVGASKEVVDFLVAVSERESRLDMVTDEVRGWLFDRNALRLFKISL